MCHGLVKETPMCDVDFYLFVNFDYVNGNSLKRNAGRRSDVFLRVLVVHLL